MDNNPNIYFKRSFEKGCIVCLSENVILQKIDSNMEGNDGTLFSIREMLKDFINLETFTDYQTVFICKECSNDLKVSYGFQCKCRQSEIFFKNAPQTLIHPQIKEEYSFYNNDINIENDDRNIEHLNLEFNEHETKSAEKQNYIKMNSSNRVSFNCQKCGKCYLKFEDLKIHNKSQHQSIELLCNFCNQIFDNIKKYTKHIAIDHPNEWKYYCGYCGYCSSKICNIEEHLNDHQSNLLVNNDSKNNSKKSNLICEVCREQFTSNSLLKRHIKTHNPDKPFKCDFSKCKRSFRTDEDLLLHVMVNHSNNDQNECSYCGKQFQQPRLLRQHMITHKRNKRFKCKFCTKAFNLLHHKQNHERIHTGEQEYLCAECGKSFAIKERLRMHLKTHLTTNTRYECDICRKCFRNERQFKYHQREHKNGEQFMCSECGLRFASQNTLTRHSTNEHNSGNRYFCGICGYNFTSNEELNNHIKVHTFQYQCDICNKSFSLRKTLESHFRIHSVSRIYHCDRCEMTFNRAEQLKNHTLRRHTGTKPYKCDECGKRFFHSGELNIHIRSHTGERPYKCEICMKTFTRSHSLQFHMRIHTGEKPYKCAVCSKGHVTLSGLTSHVKMHNRNAIKNLEFTDMKEISEFQLDEGNLIESNEIAELLS